MYKQLIEYENDFTVFLNFIDKDLVYLTVAVKDHKNDLIDVSSNIYNKIAQIINTNSLQIVHERFYGKNCHYQKIINSRENAFKYNIGNNPLPFSYIEGKPCNNTQFAGVQIEAIVPNYKNNKVWTITENNLSYGRGWRRNNVSYLIIQNMNGYSSIPGNFNSRTEQTERMFNNIEKILNDHGSKYIDIVRTWIYLSKILEWYDDFNKIRNKKYYEYGFDLDKNPSNKKITLPASTGIEGSNPTGSATLMDILAVIRDPNIPIEIEQMNSKKQKSPFHYGSAFSRAIRIIEPNNTTIHISGTASIDEKGKSVYSKDIYGQIRKTLDIFNELISSEGATFQDISQATVFLKNSDDFDIYKKIIEEYKLENMPAVCIQANICREDLLFEIDGTICKSK